MLQGASGAASSGAAHDVDGDGSQLIAQHGALQDSLTDELVGLASQLKARTMGLQVGLLVE
jgi:hypothetical protein